MKHFSWVFTLIFIMLSLTGIFYLKQSVSAQPAQDEYEPAAAIQATHVQFSDFQPSHTVLGESVAINQVMLKNERAGKIVYLNLDPSNVVKQGQILVRIDDSEEQAQLKSAKATAILKQQTLSRIQSLYKDKRISQEKLDIASAELAIAQADVGIIESNISKKTIKAPFDAYVGLHNLAIGQTLAQDDDITQLIGVNDNIWVDFNVPQVYPMLDKNSTVNVSLPQQAKGVTATIISSAPTLRGQSRQVHYRAELSLDKLAIKPQFLVNVILPVAQNESAIIVPSLAITRDQLGEYVFVVNEEASDSFRVTRRQVQLGDRLTQGVVIDSGLEQGERIATIGAFKLREGLKVFIEPTPMDEIVELSENGGIR